MSDVKLHRILQPTSKSYFSYMYNTDIVCKTGLKLQGYVNNKVLARLRSVKLSIKRNCNTH